jgi:hypothetical protein
MAARAEHVVAFYRAYWAGLPAGQIRLELDDAGGSFRDTIAIDTSGLPRLVTHFHGGAEAVGRLAAGRAADPARYDARYDLRRRRDRRIGIRFVVRNGAAVADRSADDTSRKPPLAEKYRRGVVDPLTALECVRAAVAAHRTAAPRSRFSVPVYDGARRFDVIGRILPKSEHSPGLLPVELSLRPIAGFKGESSEDGDPDDAPRPVSVMLSDDARLLPVSLSVRVFYLPLVVELDHICTAAAACTHPPGSRPAL